MKTNYFAPPLDMHSKLLCSTHSSRAINYNECDRNSLKKRYSNPQRLPPTENFSDLFPSTHHTAYTGSVTIWEFTQNNFDSPKILASIDFDNQCKKPQHAIWHNGQIWILFIESILILSSTLEPVREIHHPWLSGGHTLAAGPNGLVYISCSASDSILVYSEYTDSIMKTLRVPETHFGYNYPLKETDSVVKHYIHNDIQLSHINSACPWKNGVLFTTLIQGAVGYFNSAGQYSELTRGFVGAHGIRSNKNTLYFCDSCKGNIVFISEKGHIKKRINCHSRWLHDAQHIEGDIFATSISDRNSIDIIDISTMEIINSIDCSKFGESTQFLYWGN